MNFADKIMAEIKEYVEANRPNNVSILTLRIINRAINDMIEGTSWVDV